MILRYAIVLAVVVILALLARWAFLPAPHLPANRAPPPAAPPAPAAPTRRGFAPPSPCGCGGDAWAALRRSGRDPPSLRCTSGSVTRAPTRCSWAGRTTGTASRSRWKSTFS